MAEDREPGASNDGAKPSGAGHQPDVVGGSIHGASGGGPGGSGDAPASGLAGESGSGTDDALTPGSGSSGASEERRD